MNTYILNILPKIKNQMRKPNLVLKKKYSCTFDASILNICPTLIIKIE